MADKMIPVESGENLDGKGCKGQFACDGCYWCYNGGQVGNRIIPGCVLASCKVYPEKPYSILYEGAPCQFRADPEDQSFSTGLENLAKSIQGRYNDVPPTPDPDDTEFYVEPDSEFAYDPEAEEPYQFPYDDLAGYGIVDTPYRPGILTDAVPQTQAYVQPQVPYVPQTQPMMGQVQPTIPPYQPVPQVQPQQTQPVVGGNSPTDKTAILRQIADLVNLIRKNNRIQ